MQKSKKMNTYLKYGLIMGGCLLAGGVVGFCSAILRVEAASVKAVVQGIVELLRDWLLAEFLILLLVEAALGEWYLAGMRKLGKQIREAEDESGDRLEDELERKMSWGTFTMNMCFFLYWILMGSVYSLDYLDTLPKGELLSMLAAFVLMILGGVYNGFWGVRTIKLAQKIDPTKKGDPASVRFTEQWMESCDEAEREMIYRASFGCYCFMSRWLPIVILGAFLVQLLWNTGTMAIIVSAAIWMMMQGSYLKNCRRRGKS